MLRTQRGTFLASTPYLLRLAGSASARLFAILSALATVANCCGYRVSLPPEYAKFQMTRSFINDACDAEAVKSIPGLDVDFP